jgi:L-ascorbate metabolism protein UlaG (beta-lactamase superfamily)
MDIQFYGANCLTLTYKGTRLVIDDNLAELGGKSIMKAGDVALYTAFEQPETKVELKLFVNRPGEYEMGDIAIKGVAVRAHMDETGTKLATMYKVTIGDISVLFTGHAHPNVTETELEAISQVQVLVVPVGGMGYTLDAVGALKLVKEFEPKLVIPTHYADKALNFPVPQQELEVALKELGMEPKERTGKLKLKPADLLVEGTQLIVLEKN